MIVWIACWLTAENEVIKVFTGDTAEQDAKAFVESQGNAEDYVIWRTVANDLAHVPTAYQWKATETE